MNNTMEAIMAKFKIKELVILSYNRKIDNTSWEIYKDKNLTDKIFESLNDTINLTSISTPLQVPGKPGHYYSDLKELYIKVTPTIAGCTTIPLVKKCNQICYPIDVTYPVGSKIVETDHYFVYDLPAVFGLGYDVLVDGYLNISSNTCDLSHGFVYDFSFPLGLDSGFKNNIKDLEYI